MFLSPFLRPPKSSISHCAPSHRPTKCGTESRYARVDGFSGLLSLWSHYGSRSSSSHVLALATRGFQKRAHSLLPLLRDF